MRQSFSRHDDGGIRAFLVPKTTPSNYAHVRRLDGQQAAQGTQGFAHIQPFNAHRCAHWPDALPPYVSSVGKQTVAEAASTRGAPLDAYADPASEEEDIEERQQNAMLSPADIEAAENVL